MKTKFKVGNTIITTADIPGLANTVGLHGQIVELGNPLVAAFNLLPDMKSRLLVFEDGIMLSPSEQLINAFNALEA